AHQAEAFIAVDQRHVERLALRGMHDGRRVDRSQPLADPPFQPRAAGEWTDDAGIEHRASGVRAELIGQLAAREVIEIGLEGRVLIAGHACRSSQVSRWLPNRFWPCGAKAINCGLLLVPLPTAIVPRAAAGLSHLALLPLSPSGKKSARAAEGH